MGVREHFEPRNLNTARRSGAAFAAAGAVLLTALTLALPQFAPGGAGRLSTLLIAVALAVLAAVQLRAPSRLPTGFYAFVPTIALALAVYLDLVTKDASAAGQIFLTWPVLFAAYELRPVAAAVVLVQVLAADAVIVFRLLPTATAVIDLVCVGTTLAIFCLLLVRAREHEAGVVAELERQVAVDQLTGLGTRRVLDDAARTAVGQLDRDCSLLLLDIDDFKVVNDELGHPAGDDVLIHVADLLRRHFEPPALVARLGGDELAVLLPGSALPDGVEAAEAFCRRLRSSPARLATGSVPIRVSVGAASTSGRLPQHSLLYAAADQALYAAKRGGRDQVRAATVTGAVPLQAVEARPASHDAAPRRRRNRG